MDFSFQPEEEAFRDEVSAFLSERNPNRGSKRAHGAEVGESDDDIASLPKLLAWNQALYERGWVGFSWPKEVGGGGGRIIEQMILKEETARRARRCSASATWVSPGSAPRIIQYGTDEQKQRFIPQILAAEDQWCTGYSEPGSGSDLASLQCRAVRDGDEYVVNGQKIWTSLAMWAQWIILLVRTDFAGGEAHAASPACSSR